MKKLNMYKWLFISMGVMTLSCSKLLDRQPLLNPSSTTFLNFIDNMNVYANNYYNALPRHNNISTLIDISTTTSPTLNFQGVGLWGIEVNSDNIISSQPDIRLNGQNTVSSPNAIWSVGYTDIRSTNYFLSNYAANVSGSEQYAGESYFFRAYFHYTLFTLFGNIVLVPKLLDDQATLAGLQIPQSSRTETADFIIADLDRAYQLLPLRSTTNGLRVSKEAALILKARVALYEGSWEKYHATDGFGTTGANPNKYFQIAVDAIDSLFTLNTISINTNSFGNPNTTMAFKNMFIQQDLSNVTEAVFWKKFDVGQGISSTIQSFLQGGYSANSTGGGISKSLAFSYLMNDGTPIKNAPSTSLFQDSTYTQFFRSRDPRLTQTILSPEQPFKSWTDGGAVADTLRVPFGTITQKRGPNLFATGAQLNTTGFHLNLGLDASYNTNINSNQAWIYIRFAEALLIYAEAKAEMGIITQADLDNTINVLRVRVGMPNLTIGVGFTDPDWPNWGYTLTPLLQEIRRERRVELALQGFRLDDLMRWAAHNIFVGDNNRPKGAYFANNNDLVRCYDLLEFLKLTTDEDGFIDPYKTKDEDYSPRNTLPNGYQFRPNRDYLYPIPASEIVLNQKLKQNPGWN